MKWLADYNINKDKLLVLSKMNVLVVCDSLYTIFFFSLVHINVIPFSALDH